MGPLAPRGKIKIYVFISEYKLSSCNPRTKRSREELPHVRGQGQQPRVPGCDCAGMAETSYSSQRSGAAAGRSYPTPTARGRGREDQPHVQGAVAMQAQEGLEELSHIEGQEGQQ